MLGPRALRGAGDRLPPHPRDGGLCRGARSIGLQRRAAKQPGARAGAGRAGRSRADAGGAEPHRHAGLLLPSAGAGDRDRAALRLAAPAGAIRFLSLRQGVARPARGSAGGGAVDRPCADRRRAGAPRARPVAIRSARGRGGPARLGLRQLDRLRIPAAHHRRQGLELVRAIAQARDAAMSRVLVTGANGYVGRALAARLKERLQAQEIDSLTLLDLGFDNTPTEAGIRCISGDLGDPACLAQATEPAPTVVFHLAGIMSRQAEEDFALGMLVNVSCTIGLFERLRSLGHQPVVVYSSSIGIYGAPLPHAIDDYTPIAPALSYGAQKRMIEILLADYSRRGWIDGRAVRLPGVVARPAAPNGALSAFASDLIREPAEGRRYAC